MASRSLLRSPIAEAWTLSINENHVDQRINSELSLQTAVWSQCDTTGDDAADVH
jgi:hypothetical protein